MSVLDTFYKIHTGVTQAHEECAMKINGTRFGTREHFHILIPTFGLLHAVSLPKVGIKLL